MLALPCARKVPMLLHGVAISSPKSRTSSRPSPRPPLLLSSTLGTAPYTYRVRRRIGTIFRAFRDRSQPPHRLRSDSWIPSRSSLVSTDRLSVLGRGRGGRPKDGTLPPPLSGLAPEHPLADSWYEVCTFHSELHSCQIAPCRSDREWK